MTMVMTRMTTTMMMMMMMILKSVLMILPLWQTHYESSPRKGKKGQIFFIRTGLQLSSQTSWLRHW